MSYLRVDRTSHTELSMSSKSVWVGATVGLFPQFRPNEMSLRCENTIRLIYVAVHQVALLFSIAIIPLFCVQAMARVWRDGQRKTVHIYRLLTAGQNTTTHKMRQEMLSYKLDWFAVWCLGVALSPRHNWGAYIPETGVQTGAFWDCGWPGQRGGAHQLLHQWTARSLQPDRHPVSNSRPAELQLRHGWICPG